MNEFVSQGALSLVVKIKPGQTQNLRAILAQMVPPAGDVEDNDLVPFAQLSKVHFARFVVLDQSLSSQATLRDIEPVLVFSTNYDGSLNDHLKEIINVAREGLDKIYSLCEGYPKQLDDKRRIRYLKSLRQPYGAFHCGTHGLSVGRIKLEAKLRDEIACFIDVQRGKNPEWINSDPTQIKQDIKDHIQKSNELKACLVVPNGSSIWWKLFRRTAWKTVLKFLLLLPLALLFSPILVILLRYKEKNDKIFPKIRYDDRAKELAAREDKVVQNQMTNLVDMKSGWFRKVTLNLFFMVIEILARYIFTKGKLGSIPTIHFARWIYVDGGKSLLFFSNYGSSWESYLGDFVDKAPEGLNGIWSNSVLYPTTKWLIGEGAADEERFKCWARAQQMPTDVWYSAYKTITVKNILMNKEIRIGLASDKLTEEQLKDWLSLL